MVEAKISKKRFEQEKRIQRLYDHLMEEPILIPYHHPDILTFNFTLYND